MLPCGFLAIIFLFQLPIIDSTSLGYLLVDWYMSRKIDYFTLNMITSAPYIALVTACLVLYILGRKEFLKCLEIDKTKSGLLMIFGAIVAIAGFFFSWYVYNTALWGNFWPPGEPSFRSLVNSYPYLVWSILLFILGLVWFADGFRKSRISRNLMLKENQHTTVLGSFYVGNNLQFRHTFTD